MSSTAILDGLREIATLLVRLFLSSKGAYQPEPACDWCTSLVNYIEEPDQALVAEDDAGYCFGVFRGTTPTAVDWGQNIDPRNEPVCTTKDRSACCTTRQGFYDAYITSYHQKMEKEVRKCARKRPVLLSTGRRPV